MFVTRLPGYQKFLKHITAEKGMQIVSGINVYKGGNLCSFQILFRLALFIINKSFESVQIANVFFLSFSAVFR